MLAVARASGAIELLSPLTGELRGSIAPVAASSSGGDMDSAADASRIAGLHLLWGEADGSSGLPTVLSVTHGGAARLHAPQPPAEGAGGETGGGCSSWHQLRTWATPPQVCCTALDAGSATLAVGCQGAELRLFDVSTGALTWAAKGGKPNMVGLVDHPWNTAVAFLPPPQAASGGDAAAAASGDGGSGGKGPCHRLLVGTGHHKLRLYDSSVGKHLLSLALPSAHPSTHLSWPCTPEQAPTPALVTTPAGKRPQADLPWGEARVTALAVEPGGQRCWVANGAGLLECLDLRSRRLVGAIKGTAGKGQGGPERDAPHGSLGRRPCGLSLWRHAASSGAQQRCWPLRLTQSLPSPIAQAPSALWRCTPRCRCWPP